MDTCTNDPNKSSTTRKNKHKMWGYSLIRQCSFDEKKKKIEYYRGKDFLKKFCQDIKNKLINSSL